MHDVDVFAIRNVKSDSFDDMIFVKSRVVLLAEFIDIIEKIDITERRLALPRYEHERVNIDPLANAPTPVALQACA